MANDIASNPSNNQLANALDHLANIVITNKGTMATLTEHIKKLTHQNNALIKQNGMLITKIAHSMKHKPQKTNNATRKRENPTRIQQDIAGHTDSKSTACTTCKCVLTNYWATKCWQQFKTPWG